MPTTSSLPRKIPTPSPDEAPQELNEGALAVRFGSGVQEHSLIERVTRAEQGSNNLPEQLFDLGIIVRELPDPVDNAPPVNHRARGGVFMTALSLAA